VSLAFLFCSTEPPSSGNLETPTQEAQGALKEALPLDDSSVILQAFEPWTGDLEGMIERRFVRVLTTFNKTHYYLDRGAEKGLVYDGMKELEKLINKKFRTGRHKVQMAFLPVRHDELIPFLLEGKGDVIAANLTITDDRLKLVDFTTPVRTDVRELVVSGPKAKPVRSLEDLSGQEVFVRGSSSYANNLASLNNTFEKKGIPPVRVVHVEKDLEAEDLLEMVNDGIVSATVVDSHMAEFWGQVLDRIIVHEDLPVSGTGSIGIAFRKNSPALEKTLNEFVKTARKGTLLGNILLKRYLRDTKKATTPPSEAENARFEEMAGLFEKYSAQYEFDWILIAAQAFRESRFDQSSRSKVGAVGVMQLLPSTAADPNVGIPDISTLENNIHAGVKYLRFIADRYFADENMEDLDRTLLSFAAYNAGPRGITEARTYAKNIGLDPNRWFHNVEVAAAKKIGIEPVQYVNSILKYYVSYKLISQRRTAKAAG
jgi:membrane-bound lytic murein transglycosylase MltF